MPLVPVIVSLPEVPQIVHGFPDIALTTRMVNARTPPTARAVVTVHVTLFPVPSAHPVGNAAAGASREPRLTVIVKAGDGSGPLLVTVSERLNGTPAPADVGALSCNRRSACKRVLV